MKGNLLWRGLLVVAALVVALVAALPLDKKINLGLDLQGGMHLVLQVKTEDALRAETESDMERLVNRAADDGMTGLRPRRINDTSFEVAGLAPGVGDTLSELAENQLSGWDSRTEGDRMIFTMQSGNVDDIRKLAVTQAVQTIRNRIDAFGVAEPVIQEADNQRIVVQLPGVDDPERVQRLIKNTAFLEFRIVKFPQGGGNGVPSRETILANYGGRLPEELEILEGDVRDNQGDVVGKTYYAVEKRRAVTGRDLKTARPAMGQFRDPIVQFSLTSEGANKFGDLTGNNVGSGLAIVLDGRVVSAPVIRSRITSEGVIEGQFTQQEVQDLSTVLRSGALPAGIVTLEERTVGPSLGRDSIRDSLIAGVAGTILVVLYMLIIYSLSGLNAVIALALNILLLFGGLAAFDATLTLPGIAGIILTIGMAVDANVLVFERIREELRAGRTVRSAIDLGFEKALSSIVDSNVTTLIAALFLFQFGTGPIRGFAVTLTIGLLASMFTAVFVSRWMFDFVLSRRRVQKLSIGIDYTPAPAPSGRPSAGRPAAARASR
ncbi:MAG TPA: protein translocase subunit SecD [Thermoanaerobaculia bacterium]|nr:protein translocase subunit SecD [Thermoanaerobaculia bacterium]